MLIIDKKLISTETQIHKNIIFLYFRQATKISHTLPEKVMKIFACSLNNFLNEYPGASL